MYGNSANSVPGQSFRTVYLEYVIGRCFWPAFISRISPAVFLGGALSRHLQTVFASGIFWCCFRKCYRSVSPRKRFPELFPTSGIGKCPLKNVSRECPWQLLPVRASRKRLQEMFPGRVFRRYFGKARRYYAESASEVCSEHYIGQYYR